jgi:hypothetical protein
MHSFWHHLLVGPSSSGTPVRDAPNESRLDTRILKKDSQITAGSFHLLLSYLLSRFLRQSTVSIANGLDPVQELNSSYRQPDAVLIMPSNLIVILKYAVIVSPA